MSDSLLDEIEKHLRAFADAHRETMTMHGDVCKDFLQDHRDMGEAIEHMGAITRSMCRHVTALGQRATEDE